MLKQPSSNNLIPTTKSRELLLCDQYSGVRCNNFIFKDGLICRFLMTLPYFFYKNSLVELRYFYNDVLNISRNEINKTLVISEVVQNFEMFKFRKFCSKSLWFKFVVVKCFLFEKSSIIA